LIAAPVDAGISWYKIARACAGLFFLSPPNEGCAPAWGGSACTSMRAGGVTPRPDDFQGDHMTMSSKATALVALTLFAGCAQAQATSADSNARSARYLAANCANCHGTNGSAQGAMPSLAGQQKSYIVDQMTAFREGKRPATIMNQISKGYTDQQIELIADHFSRQTPAR